MRTMESQTEASRGRLLVVDDDLVQRTVIVRMATRLGYDTMTASTFDMAAGFLQQETFGAMTLDLSLGERDGVELLRLIAECGFNDLPIVIISGCDERILNSTRRVADSLNLSLMACLTKPLNLDKLRASLHLPRQPRTDASGPAATPDLTRALILAGLERREISVEFQPKIDLTTGKVVGAEALARWRSPEFGPISPAVFVPAAERVGLMPELTSYILSAAMTQGRGLVEQHPGFTIAVNVSGSLMADLMLPENIAGIW
jgi:DNA-binding response OmpR family regulator